MTSAAPPAAEATARIEIPFHDVDAMRIVWHGNYFRYFEVARCALLRKFNLDIQQLESNGWLFPVIKSECRYISSLHYGDIAAVTARVTEVEYKLVVDYRIIEEGSGRRIATGRTEHALLNQAGELIYPIPDEILQRFAAGGRPSNP